jgi:biotin carboxyl carrier protein
MRQLRLQVNGQWYSVQVGDVHQSPVEVMVDDEFYLVDLEAASQSPRRRPTAPRQERKEEPPGLRGITQGNEKVVRCPLPGRVIALQIIKGQQVEPGDEICLLESMKMEQSIRVAQGGIVKSVKVKINQSVNAGSPLLEMQ